MARPKKCRCLKGRPACGYFQPRGVDPARLREVCLCLDEFEAIRLADHLGCYQQEAAARMKISRPTFGRILDRAHAKVAEAILCGKALRIETRPGRTAAARTPNTRTRSTHADL